MVSPLGIIIISDFCFCAFTVELFIFVVVSSLLYINRFELCFYCAFQIECCFVILFLYWYENCSESGFAKMCLFLGSFFFLLLFERFGIIFPPRGHLKILTYSVVVVAVYPKK